jgi:hypothetical protein
MSKTPYLFGGKSEHEIRRKFVDVTFDSLVESFGRYPIDTRYVGIEHYTLAANFVNERLQRWCPLELSVNSEREEDGR